MKQIIGKAVFFLALLRIVGLFFFPPPQDTTAHYVQDWAFTFFILVFGIALAQPYKPSDAGKE